MDNETFCRLEMSQEYAALMIGVKKVWRDGVPVADKQQIENLREFCRVKKLCFEVSAAAAPRDKEHYYSYATSESVRFWIALEKKYIRRCRKLDEGHMFEFRESITDDSKGMSILDVHLEFGDLFGYPPCCTKFFLEQSLLQKEGKTRASSTYADLVLKAWERSSRHSFLLNNLIRGKDFNLIVHKPCAYDCSGSISMAEKILEYHREHNPGYHQALNRFLNMPVVYFENQNRIVAEGKVVAGNALAYTRLHATDGVTRDFLFANRSLLDRGDTLEFSAADVRCLSGSVLLGKIPVEKQHRPFPLIFDFE